jgi:aldose 1-epimerase
LTLTPTSPDPVPVAFGFHPYLTLPGSDRRSWRIELPVRRRARLDERGIPTGEHEPVSAGSLDGPLGDRRFDDSFDELGRAPVFAVSDARRRVQVEFLAGYRVAQVYAPGGSDFICFEPMTAPVDALRSGRDLVMTGPDASFLAEFAVTVTDP